MESTFFFLALQLFSAALRWILWSSIILICTFIVWYTYWKTTRNKRLIDRIPGFKDWPLVGDVLHISFDPKGTHSKHDFSQIRFLLSDCILGIVNYKHLPYTYVFLWF